MAKKPPLALVTGGSRGIGKGIAHELALNGFDLVLLAKSKDNLEKAKREITSDSRTRVDALQCDVSDPKEIERAFKQCKDRGYGIDVLVHSAGIFIEGCDLDSSLEVYDATMNVNLRAIYYLTRLFRPLLKGRPKPRVIIIGSTAGLEAYTIGSVYGIAKWGLRGYAINLREELKKDRIGVTLINPGSTFTDLWAGTKHPPSRFVQPRDIGKLVVSSLSLAKNTVVDEIVVRPMLGDIHDE